MGLLHAESVGPGQPRPPVTLLESFSPYGSRKVTVEYDGLTTAAYLHDDTSAISATWIANPPARSPVHRPGQAGRRARAADARRANRAPAGQAAAAGRRAGSAVVRGKGTGRDPGERAAGRGHRGWCDMDRGMPGYSSDVIGQTPFGWSLDDAMEGLRPAGTVPGLLALAAVGQRVGAVPAGAARPPAAAAQAGRPGNRRPPGRLTGVTERPSGPHRPYTVLSTVGMSCQRMPVVEQVLDDPSRYARIELAIATTLPSARRPGCSCGSRPTPGAR